MVLKEVSYAAFLKHFFKEVYAFIQQGQIKWIERDMKPFYKVSKDFHFK